MKRKFILCAALILCILVGVSIFIPITSYKRATANFDPVVKTAEKTMKITYTLTEEVNP